MVAQNKFNYVWQMVSLDLMGPFPRSSHSFVYLLVVSKFVLLNRLRQAAAAPIVKYLKNGVFLMVGVLQIVMKDNGTVFTGQKFRSLIKDYKIPRLMYTSRYTPYDNHTERVNRVIGTTIRSYVTDRLQRDWDKNIHKIGFAISSTVSEGNFHGCVHAELEAKLPVEQRQRYIEEIISSLKIIHEEWKQRLNEAYHRNESHYNVR